MSLKNSVDFLDEWKLVLPKDKTFPGWPEVTFSDKAYVSVMDQIKKLERCNIYFIPSENDSEICKDIFDFDKHPYQHGKIGHTWECKVEDGQMYVKMYIQNQYRNFPFERYNFCLGLHSGFNEYVDGFQKYHHTITNCRVEGFYWYPMDRNLYSYYKLRSVNMYVYLPGRAYY